MITNSIKQLALNTLSTLHEEEKRYNAANTVIRNIEADFPPVLFPINFVCSKSVVDLLDAILGDDIATYFLFEAANMKQGGKIIEDGKEWPIRNMDDVKAYVFRGDVG